MSERTKQEDFTQEYSRLAMVRGDLHNKIDLHQADKQKIDEVIASLSEEVGKIKTLLKDLDTEYQAFKAAEAKAKEESAVKAKAQSDAAIAAAEEKRLRRAARAAEGLPLAEFEVWADQGLPALDIEDVE